MAKLRVRADLMYEALKLFADKFEGDLANVGGGTHICLPLTIQNIKDAKHACKNHEEGR